MKKYFAVFLTLVLILSLSLGSVSEDLGEYIRVTKNLVKLEVNGQRVISDNFLYKGTTYIPLRKVSELLDKNVGWNIYTKVASVDDGKYELEILSNLLPGSKGFQWTYDGFAEYSHQMKIDNIIDGDKKREYIISGQVGDPSDGESKINRDIKLKYKIMGNKLIQEKTEKAMLDSKFDKMTLIQSPLIAGTFWEEEVKDRDGKKTTINGYIKMVEIKDNGKKEYTIRYDDINSKYYEIRTIQDGMGVVNFEKLMELEDSSFPVNYFIYGGEDPEKIEVKLHFPDKNAEKLNVEKRTLNVYDKNIAKASIEALIDGPRDKKDTSSIPKDTILLNIYIKENICFVDFSKEFISNHSGGSAGELMTLYSIVNTLTEYKTIKGVQILVEGEKGRSLGNIILDKPLKRKIEVYK